MLSGRHRLVTAADTSGQFLLLGDKEQQLLKYHLLDRLQRGTIDLPAHPIEFGVRSFRMVRWSLKWFGLSPLLRSRDLVQVDSLMSAGGNPPWLAPSSRMLHLQTNLIPWND